MRMRIFVGSYRRFKAACFSLRLSENMQATDFAGSLEQAQRGVVVIGTGV